MQVAPVHCLAQANRKSRTLEFLRVADVHSRPLGLAEDRFGPWSWDGCFARLATSIPTKSDRVPMSTATASPPRQAIAGVSPAEIKETTVMTVWPSVAMFGPGRMMGQAFAQRWPDIYFFRLGNLFALLAIPFALALYAARIGIRYRITNRRIIVEKGPFWKEDKFVELDRFDSVEVVVQPGQAWYHAGDLVFKLGNVETFRLDGVSRPDAFRAACVKANQAYVGVKRARERQRQLAR
jgi:hypothetical protein